MSHHIETKLLIMSDSHGKKPLSRPMTEHIDVLIHCGDLTQESKLVEFQNTLQYLEDIPADLKLVIAGNHDFTLDVPAFEKIVQSAVPSLEPELVRETYGDCGDIKNTLFKKAKSANIILLDEGSYDFNLRNGALLRVYASPFTPSASGNCGFQYHPNQGHNFEIPQNIDVVITHGPPKGILDRTSSWGRVGCPELFQAVAHARPRLHCFGHLHENWGGKRVTWRRTAASNGIASHFTHIDNSKSTVLCNISQLETARENGGDMDYFPTDCNVLEPQQELEQQTLFLNAALLDDSNISQIPWLVTIPLPHAEAYN